MKESIRAWAWSMMLMATVLLVSACSTTEQKPANNAQPSGDTQEQGSAPETKPDSQPPIPSAQQGKSPASTEPKALPEHKTIEFSVEGMKETKQGTLFKSDQGYYLYILPRFEASAEEPGRDIVMAQYDDRHTMRIQLLPQDVNADKEVENARQELATVGEVHEQTDVADPFFKQAKAYLFASDGQYTREIILQQLDGRWFRITLSIAHAESAEGTVPSFWAMLKTIGIQK